MPRGWINWVRKKTSWSFVVLSIFVTLIVCAAIERIVEVES